jgi:hypothetical protein
LSIVGGAMAESGLTQERSVNVLRAAVKMMR